jgi:hypothetical protein
MYATCGEWQSSYWLGSSNAEPGMKKKIMKLRSPCPPHPEILVLPLTTRSLRSSNQHAGNESLLINTQEREERWHSIVSRRMSNRAGGDIIEERRNMNDVGIFERAADTVGSEYMRKRKTSNPRKATHRE